VKNLRLLLDAPNWHYFQVGDQPASTSYQTDIASWSSKTTHRSPYHIVRVTLSTHS
jgi:hypothetical protein